MSYGGFTISNRLNGIFSSSTIDEPVTLVCWIKYTAANWANTTQNYIMALSKDTSLEDMFAIGGNAGTADEVYLIANAGSAKLVEANTGNTSWQDGDYDDVWVPVVAVFASTTSSTIYIENSTLNNSSATVKDIALGATPQIRIGAAPNNNAATPGQVAEVAIFNRALTPAEIDELQIRPGVGIPPWKVAPDNCVGYWSLKDDKASHAPDYTVDEGTPNLTVVGSPTYSTDHPTILSGNDIFIVDSVSAESNGTTDISDSVATLGLTLQKDDVIVACISNNDAGNTLGINDNSGGAFIPITNRVQGNTYSHRCFFYVVGDTPLTTFAFDMDAYSGRMSRTYIQLRGANTTLPIQSVEVSTGTSAGVLPNPGRTQYLNTLALAFVTDDAVSTAGDDITGWTEYTELVEANGAAGQIQAAGYRYQ